MYNLVNYLKVFMNPIHTNFFPSMPESVFEMWLEPIIESYGWPFTSINDDMKLTKWAFIFGLNTTLREWHDIQWDKCLIKRSFIKNMMANSLFMPNEIYIYAVHGQQTKAAGLFESKKRFWAVASFLEHHGCFPKPLVFRRTGQSLSLLDGNHRLATLLHVPAPEMTEIPAWVVTL